MNYNIKSIKTIFVNKKIMSDAFDVMQDSIDDDMTFEEGMSQFLYDFEIIASEFLAVELFNIDIEQYGETHNDQLNAHDLQTMIDGESDDE